jgi:hypothetical protein
MWESYEENICTCFDSDPINNSSIGSEQLFSNTEYFEHDANIISK